MFDTWLPRLLFALTLAAAAALAAVVLIAPWLHDPPRLLGLFAHDTTVRRTALASALGLTVTACVFFRPGGPGKKSSSKPPKSGNIAGA